MTLRKVGRYELIAEIGKGGMATVFRAFDPMFKREVAVKVLDKSLLHEPSLKARFEREAQTIAALEHPAIVPVYDFGEEEGHLYLVMRLMLGGSLAGRVSQGPLPLTDVLHILQRIGGALDRAHQKGVIHRDLKPGNIMFDEYGDAFLGDFGIARLTESTVTLTGDNIIGTPAYMSPEQIHGDKSLDSRSDIYALGVICFEMLTGQRPYTDSSPSRVMMRHVMDPIPDIRQLKPDLPPRVENVITQSMAKEPAERFATASELTDTFEGVLRAATGSGSVQTTTVVDFSPQTEPAAPFTPVAGPPADPTPLPIEHTAQTEIVMPSFVQQAPPASGRPIWLVPLLAALGGLIVVAAIIGGIVYAVNQMGRGPDVGAVEQVEATPVATTAEQVAGTAVADDEAEAESAAESQPPDQAEFDEFLNRFAESFGEGNYLRALAIANEAIARMPEVAWWYHERASAQWALGLFEQAVASNLQGLELEPDHASLVSQRASFLYFDGQIEQALELHNRAIGLEPNNPHIYVELAITYRGIGRYQDAVEALSRAIELDPGQDGFYAERALTYQKMSEVDLAMTDLQAGLALNPANPWLYDQMAEIQAYYFGDFAAAADSLQRAIELLPTGGRYNLLADVSRRLGDGDAALRYNNEAIALEPEVGDFYAGRAETYWHSFGDLERALADMDQAIDLDPDRADYFGVRGQLHFHMGNRDAALADYDHALELDDGIPWIHVGRALLYRELGNFAAAVADLDRALELEPTNANSFLERGYTYLWLGEQPLKALADFNVGLEIDDHSAPLYLARAQVYANYLDQVEAALADLDFCIDIAPEYPWCYQERASIHDRSGRIAAAVADFRQFLELVIPDECPECVQHAETYIQEHDG